MRDVMAIAEYNQKCAENIIRQAGIREIWSFIGASVNLVSSLRSGLLMKRRDIDFHIYSNTLRLADSFSAMARLAENPAVRRIECTNLMYTEEQCIEWHAYYEDNGTEWQLDMIHMQKGSKYDGYFERVADRIRDALTPETKRIILELKDATPEHEKILGIEYYQAVLRDGVCSYSEFLQWRAMHPITGIMHWIP